MGHFSLFQVKNQIDVTTLLMLLGEATIWKAIWTRMRGQRTHWTHYIFTVSPGWTTLAGTLFASMDGGIQPLNLIFERIPEGCSDTKLMFTNLNSGATHSADQTILHNIWGTWVQGIENKTEPTKDAGVDFTRQVGVMDVDLDKLTMTKRLAISIQMICLGLQVTAGIAFCAVELNAEVLIVLMITLCGQVLLIVAITPRSATWTKVVRGHRKSAVMLHKGLDSSKVLIIPRATMRGREISLEEFCWSADITTSARDKFKAAGAALAFIALVVSNLMIGWMGQRGKVLYLIIGSLGLLANMLDAASHPDWSTELKHAFSGAAKCSPRKSSLMGCVGVLIAGQFPGASEAAKNLYPNNARFNDSLQSLENECNRILCANCRRVIREGHTTRSSYPCVRQQTQRKFQENCAFAIGKESQACDSKQLSDALATVSSLFASLEGNTTQPIDTAYKTLLGPKHKYW
jgi:hypothetical protein